MTSLVILQLVYLHCSIWLPSANAALLPTLVFKPLTPLLPILYILPLHPRHRLLLLVVSLHLLFLFPTDFLKVLQWNAGSLRARSTELLHFLSSHPIDLFVSRNLTLTHVPLSGFLNSLLCDLIAPAPSLAFSLLIPRTLAAASSFSSGMAYPSLFLRLTPTLIM